MFIDDLVHHGEAVDFSFSLEGLPAQVFHHGGDAAGVSVVFLNEPGGFSLDLFESLDVLVFVGVPHCAGVLEYRADERNVGSCFETFITIAEIPTILVKYSIIELPN